MKIDRRSFLQAGLATTTLAASAPSSASAAGAAEVRKTRVVQHVIRLPLLIYPGALVLPAGDPAAAIERLIHENSWGNDWRDGIYTYHHYHSTAHECLLVYRGSAKVQLGGEGGIIATISAGDVVIIPAGVGHKNVGATDLQIVGAYPPGQQPDMCYGKPDERPRTDGNIARLPTPTIDPVYGKSGPLVELWHAPHSAHI
jgi:uncharacterized protein YjlB